MGTAKSILKCVHPLLLVSVVLLVLLIVGLPPEIGLFSDEHGPCSAAPVFIFLLYGPVLFCGLLGLGFSGIRLFVMTSSKQSDEDPSQHIDRTPR